MIHKATKHCILQAICFLCILANSNSQTKSTPLPDSFNRINDTLKNSYISGTPEKYQVSYHKLLKSKKLNTFTSERIQALVQITQQITELSEVLKSHLKALDEPGMRTDIAYPSLVQNKDWEVFKTQLQQLYTLSLEITGFSTTGHTSQIESIFPHHKLLAHKNHEALYFKDIPTVAAITLLNKIQYDSKQLAEYVLSGILQKQSSQTNK